jgi:hypothetical protein
MIETCVWPLGSLQAVESAILNCEQLRTVLQKNADHSLRVSFPRSGRKKDVEKRGYTLLVRTFLRCSMTVLAYSLATSSQKYLV